MFESPPRAPFRRQRSGAFLQLIFVFHTLPFLQIIRYFDNFSSFSCANRVIQKRPAAVFPGIFFAPACFIPFSR